MNKIKEVSPRSRSGFVLDAAPLSGCRFHWMADSRAERSVSTAVQSTPA